MSVAIPRLAASLVVLRDDNGRLEVLIGRRGASARAFPGAVVFPGGKIEPGDAGAEALAGIVEGLAPAPRGAAFAALRETFEETGLWLSASPQTPADFPYAPDLSRLIPYAHWITPADRPYRFDTWFFVASVGPAEAAFAVGGEEFETLGWAAPSDILATHAQTLLPPTRHTLQRLARHRTAATTLEEARTAPPFDASETRDGLQRP